jgi:hypothetical protein
MRRRRLWLVLCPVLLLACCTGWWWLRHPTADMRFVGTWELVPDGSREVYWPNGLGAILRNCKPTTHFHWSGNDTTLLRGQNAGGTPVLSRLAATWWQAFGGPDGWLHDVVFVSPDEIRLTPRTPGSGLGDVTMQRVKAE